MLDVRDKYMMCLKVKATSQEQDMQYLLEEILH